MRGIRGVGKVIGVLGVGVARYVFLVVRRFGERDKTGEWWRVVGGHLVMLFKVEDNVYLAVVVVVVLLLYITACVCLRHGNGGKFNGLNGAQLVYVRTCT